jgi:nucleotide-binding universal stress UspA family protein
MYKKVLLAYDGSIEGRRALREGAKLAQLCRADVLLLAVVETASSVAALEGGVMISMDEQFEIYQEILAEGVERLKAMGFSPTARLGMEAPGPEIAGVAEEIGANLVVVGHRPSGPLARWLFGSVGTYLVKHLRCSVLVARPKLATINSLNWSCCPFRQRNREPDGGKAAYDAARQICFLIFRIVSGAPRKQVPTVLGLWRARASTADAAEESLIYTPGAPACK